MKAAQLDVLHNTVEDLKNELAGFKKTMAGVCRKYDDNFRRNRVASRNLHEGWISHGVAIEKINERCTCGVESEDEFETVETVSSPSPIGTPVLPEPVPLQVMPSFQVGWVTRHDLCILLTCPLLDASSSGRGPVAFESRGFCSTWSSEGCALRSFGSPTYG